MTLTGAYFRNKKGGIPDIVYYIMAILIFALVSIVAWKMFKVLNTDFQANPAISADGKTMMQSIKDRYIGVVDGAFLVVVVGMLIAVIIGAWLIPTHPALFWISIPILVFLVFLSAIYGNFFNNFTSASFADEIADFTIMKFFMSHFVQFITVAILLIAIFLFSKSRIQQEPPIS